MSAVAAQKEDHMTSQPPPLAYGIDGVGSLSENMIERAVQDFTTLGIANSLIFAANTEQNRITKTNRQPLNGVPDLRQSLAETVEIDGYHGDLVQAERRRQKRAVADTLANERHIQAVHEARTDSPICLWFYGQTGGHREANIQRLGALADQLPDEMRVGWSPIPHEFSSLEMFRENPRLPCELHQARRLQTTFEIHNGSAIVSRFGRKFQDRLAMLSTVALFAGIFHFSNQRSPGDCVAALGRSSARVGQAYGLRYIPPEPKLGWWPHRRLGAKAYGDTGAIIRQALLAAKQALTDPAWQAVEEPIDPNKQAYMTFILPLNLTDHRWGQIITDVEFALQGAYPFVTPIWVSGDAIPNPDFLTLSPYGLMATLFYPMRDTPTAVQKILDAGKAPQPAPKAELNGHSKTRQQLSDTAPVSLAAMGG